MNVPEVLYWFKDNNLFDIAITKSDFLQKFNKILKNNFKDGKENLRKTFAINNTWPHRATEITRIINSIG